MRITKCILRFLGCAPEKERSRRLYSRGTQERQKQHEMVGERCVWIMVDRKNPAAPSLKPKGPPQKIEPRAMIGLYLGTLACIRPGNGIVHFHGPTSPLGKSGEETPPPNVLAKVGKPSHPDPRDPLFPRHEVVSVFSERGSCPESVRIIIRTGEKEE